jgi:hypothetical protein
MPGLRHQEARTIRATGPSRGEASGGWGAEGWKGLHQGGHAAERQRRARLKGRGYAPESRQAALRNYDLACSWFTPFTFKLGYDRFPSRQSGNEGTFPIDYFRIAGDTARTRR